MTAKNIVPFVDKAKIQEEAVAWIVKLDAGDVTAEQITELRLWLSQGQFQCSEFKALAELWGNLDILEALADVIPLEMAPAEQEPLSEVTGKSATFVTCRYMIAACLAVVCTGALLLFSLEADWISRLDPNSRVYVTAKGAQETITLPDGSRVKLNTDSRIKLDFTEQTRNVRLVRGEAHFDVKHNPARPFIVHVDDGTVRAVGTAFNVRFQQEEVDVIVTEGTVEIVSNVISDLTPNALAKSVSTDSQSSSTATKMAVTAGHKVTFDDRQIRTVVKVTPQVIERKLAWHEGMLLFEGDPLINAIGEINRYTDTKIIITDPELESMRVGGYFKTGDIDAMLDLFEVSFGIKVTRVDNSLVYLSKRSDLPQG